MSETWYDAEEDILGMHVKGKPSWRSVEVSDQVIVDLSKEGEIVGVEIHGAKQFFKKDAPLLVSKTSRRKH
jgi:uncharacterized protein YuzE